MTVRNFATPLLDAIAAPTDVAALNIEEQTALAEELRQVIVDTVSRTGGHLAPSLGVVELTLALLTTFNPANDKLIWDVGHQSYAYKLLTGRAGKFHTLRQHGGLCGFPTPLESEYDHFTVGHSSTSISAALGMAFARDLAKDDNHVVAVIGDGSMTAGLAYEGLNQAGDAGKKLIVILNDNEMSISKNVGALSFFLSRSLSSPFMRRTKREVEEVLKSIPKIGSDLREWAVRAQHSLKGLLTPGMLFEAFRFNYMGPVDGHNLEELTKALETAKQVDKPSLVHVLTVKGKGYAPAEENPVHFHGVGKFAPETGQAPKAASSGPCTPTYTQVFGKTLAEIAEEDDRIVAITAAMPEGTGLAPFADLCPERFVDVGICEQHAVTFAAGLASQGYRPYVAIYSTFLQRSYDQIVHDVCVQNLPVTFCVDRAGIVGEDGATHQGTLDLAFLRHIPNMSIIAPKDEEELRRALFASQVHEGPLAIRYPRGKGVGVPLGKTRETLPFEVECMKGGGNDVAVIGVGPVMYEALAAAHTCEKEDGVAVGVYNARWVKPLPEKQLIEIARSHKVVFLVEEGTSMGGFASGVLELLADAGPFPNLTVRRIGLPDAFIEHGAASTLREKYGLTADGIYAALRLALPKALKKR